MYQLVAIGDITIDLFYKGETLTQQKDRFHLAIGGKYYTDEFYHSLGGSAANVSIHAAELGMDAAAVAKVGENAFKNLIVQGLIKKTVSTEFLYFDRQHTSISTILLTPSGERTIIKYSDPKEHIYVNDHAIDRIKRSGIVFMGNLPDVSISERTTFFKDVRSTENLLALNFGSRDCSQGLSKLSTLISSIDVLFLNKYEYSELTNTKPEKVDFKKNLLKELKTKNKVLVVTDGSEGSHAYTPDAEYHQEAAKVTSVIDCTGAGDAFTAAFLIKFSDNNDIQQSLEFASEYASKILKKVGAS